AVAQKDGAPDRALAVAAHPDGRMRLLQRARQRRVAPGDEVPPLEVDALAAPRGLHGPDCLVGEVVALVEGHAERRELRLQVARRHAEDEAAAGEDVEARGRLRGEEGVPVGEHVDEGEEADARRRGGGEGEGDEGKGWSVTATASKPARSAARAVSATAGALVNSAPRSTRWGWRRSAHLMRRGPGSGSRIEVKPEGRCGPSTSCSRTPIPSRVPRRARQTCCTWRWRGSIGSRSASVQLSPPTASSPFQRPWPHSGWR